MVQEKKKDECSSFTSFLNVLTQQCPPIRLFHNAKYIRSLEKSFLLVGCAERRCQERFLNSLRVQKKGVQRAERRGTGRRRSNPCFQQRHLRKTPFYPPFAPVMCGNKSCGQYTHLVHRRFAVCRVWTCNNNPATV